MRLPKNLDHTLDFFFSADNRVKPIFLRGLGQIDAKFVQSWSLGAPVSLVGCSRARCGGSAFAQKSESHGC